jgi:serine/threonine protein kinase
MTVQLDSHQPSDDELYCPTCETGFATGTACSRDGTALIRLVVSDPLIGRVLDGRFTLLEKLGQGGMGVVYRARQHSVDREVAIKVVQANLISDAGSIKRFLREAKLTSRLSHPNAVGVLDFGQTTDGVCYLAMELVTGVTLTRALQTGGGFAPARIIRIGVQVCDALEVAHAMQIVHRDLKPSNIMLLSSGRDFVKVLDFGLAKSLVTGHDLSSTSDGGLLGTPAFVSPEQLEHGTCDGRADLYALGCVLYLLASARLPYARDARPGDVAPRLTTMPPALDHVIARLIARRPEDRYQTAAAARDALELAAAEPTVVPIAPALAPETSRRLVEPTELVSSRPRSRRWVALVVGVVITAAAAIWIAGRDGRDGRDSGRPAATAEPAPALVPASSSLPPPQDPAPASPPIAVPVADPPEPPAVSPSTPAGAQSRPPRSRPPGKVPPASATPPRDRAKPALPF